MCAKFGANIGSVISQFITPISTFIFMYLYKLIYINKFSRTKTDITLNSYFLVREKARNRELEVKQSKVNNFDEK